MHADLGGNLSKAVDLLKYLKDYDAIDTLRRIKDVKLLELDHFCFLKGYFN